MPFKNLPIRYIRLSFFFLFLLPFFTCIALFGAKPILAYKARNKINQENNPIRYASVIKILKKYENSFNSASVKIRNKQREIKELNGKIKTAVSGLKLLNKKTKLDNTAIKKLIRRIFIVQSESNTSKLLSINDSYKSFITNYQLKIILKDEKASLKKLISERKTFLNLKKYLKSERSDLIADIKNIKSSQRKLKALIYRANGYMQNIKKRYEKKYVSVQENRPDNEGHKIVNNRIDKKDRLLHHKVIKLIRIIKNKIKKSAKSNGIKFTVLGR